ncbi:hypothetical protein [Photobacterium aquimaris]|uniref:hypothetical protein n=1 Tax=Photobacterium aquimaris TaxID=512643 RepID=UPI000AE14F4E|nr:hypothetical protein [Photobacterium aquimaris]
MKSQLMVIVGLCIIIAGCSSHQAQQMGIKGGSINSYAWQIYLTKFAKWLVNEKPAEPK